MRNRLSIFSFPYQTIVLFVILQSLIAGLIRIKGLNAICWTLRPEKIRGLRQMLNREQKDEECDATMMIVVMSLVT